MRFEFRIASGNQLRKLRRLSTISMAELKTAIAELKNELSVKS